MDGRTTSVKLVKSLYTILLFFLKHTCEAKTLEVAFLTSHEYVHTHPHTHMEVRVVGILLMPALLVSVGVAPCGLGGGRSQWLSISVGGVDVGGVLAMPVPSHTHTHMHTGLKSLCSAALVSFLFCSPMFIFFLPCFVLLFAFALFLS